MTDSEFTTSLKSVSWDAPDHLLTDSTTIIIRAINFGPMEFTKEVIKRFGEIKFKDVLVTSRGLSKKALTYWCGIYGIDRETTKTFQTPTIWEPY